MAAATVARGMHPAPPEHASAFLRRLAAIDRLLSFLGCLAPCGQNPESVLAIVISNRFRFDLKATQE